MANLVVGPFTALYIASKHRNKPSPAKLDHLIRRLFGSKGEKIDPAQLEPLFKDMQGKPEAPNGADAPEEAASNAVGQKPAAKQRAPHRSRITGLDNPPVETTEIIPDLVASDPGAFERIGEEVTELPDITPAKFFKRRIIRPKFRRKECRHLPLYRQQSIFHRHGVGIPRDLIIHQSTNPPIHQSTNPPIHQSTNPPIHQSTNPSIHRPTRIHRPRHPRRDNRLKLPPA